MLLKIAIVIFPVFFLVIIGFLGSMLKLLKKTYVDSLAKFSQNFGIPFLLFFNLAILDLDSAFNFELLICFYFSMIFSFILISSISYFFFKQQYKTSIILGFCAMFSNGVLLGLPISELAYGIDSLYINYTIIIGHAPFCYLIGITFIEFASSSGSTPFIVRVRSSLKATLINYLTVGILLGIGFNLLNIQLPETSIGLLRIATSWVIPVSLFTMGGVLYYYRISNTYKIPVLIIFTSLVIQPSIVYLLGKNFWNVDIKQLGNAVLMAAMAPGLNAYFFANMYNDCREVVASTIFLSTLITIFSSTLWIYFLS